MSMGGSHLRLQELKIIRLSLDPAYRGSHSEGALAIKSFSIL